METKVKSNLIARTKYHNSLFEVIVLLVVFLLLAFFVVKPKYNNTSVKSAELKESQEQYKKVETDLENMNNLISKLEKSKEEIALADQALPLHGRITALNLLIDNLVVSSGMKLASITSEDMGDAIVAGDKKLLEDPFGADRKLQLNQITVTVTGPVEQFRQLLKLIESNSRLMDIQTISISNQDEILYKIKLKAYFYAPQYEEVKSVEE